jgi:hypothetical protein
MEAGFNLRREFMKVKIHGEWYLAVSFISNATPQISIMFLIECTIKVVEGKTVAGID